MIEKRNIEITSATDGLVIHGLLYVPENPRAIVHILHGMAEHKERYEELAQLLAKLRCVVLVSDERGHGESISDKIPLGYFADKDGWMVNLKDQNMFAMSVKEQFRHLPYFLLGHSMGSLVATSFLKRYEDMISGVIFSGMPAYAAAVPMGQKMANAFSKLQGAKKTSSALVKAASPYNSVIKNPRTDFDWLSYNTDNVDKYIADPLCGFPFTNLGYRDLMDGIIDVYSNKDWRVLKKNMPILFVVGQDDPCADVPEGFQHSLDNLAKAGYANIEANIYENMRHEIFNEATRKHVYRDVLTWLEVQIKTMESIEEENMIAG